MENNIKYNKLFELIEQANYYTKLYEEGTPEISDKAWDDLYFEIKKLEEELNIYPKNSPTQKINYEIVTSLRKVNHNHKMLSLAKTKDWNEFLQYFNNRDVVGMPKLDGLTCSLEYQNGKLIKAETRGNGLIGEDILHNAKVISSIPKHIPYYNNLVVDGEIICTESNFINFSNEYANSRNFASGSIRLLNSKECEKRKLTFVVWNVVSGFNESNSFIDNLEKVKELGFTVVPWTSSFDWDAKEFLINKAKELGYPIDGLVGRFNDISYGESLGETSHHSKAAFAYKFYDETYETKLLNIEWSMGRTGQISPIALFETVNIDGSDVSRASLSNITIMKKTLGEHPFVGQIIEISKRNQIIPKIERAKDENGKWIT